MISRSRMALHGPRAVHRRFVSRGAGGRCVGLALAHRCFVRHAPPPPKLPSIRRPVECAAPEDDTIYSDDGRVADKRLFAASKPRYGACVTSRGGHTEPRKPGSAPAPLQAPRGPLPSVRATSCFATICGGPGDGASALAAASASRASCSPRPSVTPPPVISPRPPPGTGGRRRVCCRKEAHEDAGGDQIAAARPPGPGERDARAADRPCSHQKPVQIRGSGRGRDGRRYVRKSGELLLLCLNQARRAC